MKPSIGDLIIEYLDEVLEEFDADERNADAFAFPEGAD